MKGRELAQNDDFRALQQGNHTYQHWYEPEPLLKYTQLLFSVVVVLVGLWLALQFGLMVRSDVARKLVEQNLNHSNRVRDCQLQFTQNKCDLADAVPPALHALCSEWQHCITQQNNTLRDHNSAKLWVQTLAEVLNTFIEAISIRSLLLLLVSICSVIMVTNVAFGSYKVFYYNK